MKVFVAYSKKDFEIVNSIIQKIQAQGVKLWLNDFESGENFAEKIVSELKASDCVLFFHSSNTNESQWIVRELNYALSIGKQVVPLKLDDSELSDVLNFHLDKVNFLQWNQEEEEQIIQLLISSFLFENRNSAFYKYTPTFEASKSSPKNGVRLVSSCGCLLWLSIIVLVSGISLLVFHGTTNSNNPEDVLPIPEKYEECDTVACDSAICDTIVCDTVVCDSTIGDFPVDANTGSDNDVLYAESKETDHDEFGDVAPNDSAEISIVESPTDDMSALPEDHDDNLNSQQQERTLLIMLTFIITTLLILGLKYLRTLFTRYTVKLGSDFPSVLCIDGTKVAELQAHNMYKGKLSKGCYRVDFQPQNNKSQHVSYNLSVGKNQSNYIFAEMPRLYSSPQIPHTIKIFIAGSLVLGVERDALRSVISIMYNKWQSHDFKILSYTFEDFSNRFRTNGSPQDEYQEFLRKEADWAIFVIDGQVGGITHREFDEAMAAHKNTGRPNILVLSKKDAKDTAETKAIRNQINEEKQYWSTYSTIMELKREFESTLNWDLIEMINK